MGLKKKNLKWVWVGSRFYQKLSPKPGPNLDSDPVTLKLQKNPYIYIVVNPNPPISHFSSRLTQEHA